MYKLVAIDLDGTLLNSYGEVSEENRKAIKMATEKNVNLVLASGRPIMSVKNLATELGTSNYIICGNGAITYDTQKEEVIYDKFLEKNKVLQVIKICEENSIYYNVYTEDTILTKSLNYNTLFYNQENANKSDDRKTNISIVQDIYKYVEETEKNYLKITICDNDKIVFNSIIRKLRNIKNVDVLDVAHMSRKMIKDGTEDVEINYYYTEITNMNVDKWWAIEDLSKRLGIKREEIIAIGDNINDKQMVENAGLGIMMGNSAPYMKEVANVIVSNNDDDGVAEALNKYIN